jgi:DNA polymerase III sliding clamp (beta) subunit (PCNA family)
MNESGEESNGEVDASINGGDITIGACGRYILDAIQNCDSPDVLISLKDSNSSMLFESTSDTPNFKWLSIVMPMRL